MAIDRSPRPKVRKGKSGQADLAGATQLCMRCMKRKPIQGFDKERLICAECSGAATKAKSATGWLGRAVGREDARGVGGCVAGSGRQAGGVWVCSPRSSPLRLWCR